jgi:SAM-dependent methyltransferase
MGQNLPEELRSIEDEKWLEMLIESIENPVLNGIDFPRFPTDEIQTTFVGSANHETLNEAFNFYKFLKEEAGLAGKPVQGDSRFLDFGCGWGRFLRLFWKDVDIDNLFGCDTNKMIVETCQNLNVPGNIEKINPNGYLPYPDAYFDAIMAYSVFTHLPEQVHLHWVRELARVAKEGSIFCLTLEPRRFFDFIDELPQQSENGWYEKLLIHKPNLAGYYDSLDAGNLVLCQLMKAWKMFMVMLSFRSHLYKKNGNLTLKYYLILMTLKNFGRQYW